MPANLLTDPAVIVSAAVDELVPTFAVMVVVAFAVTAAVSITNVPVANPPSIVAVAGTVADFELLDRFTVRPLTGATLLKVIVPVALVPPATLVGLTVSFVMTGGVMVIVVPMDDSPRVAVILAVVFVETPLVATLTFVDFAPAGITTF